MVEPKRERMVIFPSDCARQTSREHRPSSAARHMLLPLKSQDWGWAKQLDRGRTSAGAVLQWAMNLYKPFALALDRVDFFVTHVRFRILDWVCEPETPTPAD